MSISNNPPFAVLELDEETANFLMKNASANVRMGLGFLQMAKSRETAELLVEQLEGWKKLRGFFSQPGDQGRVTGPRSQTQAYVQRGAGARCRLDFRDRDGRRTAWDGYSSSRGRQPA